MPLPISHLYDIARTLNNARNWRIIAVNTENSCNCLLASNIWSKQLFMWLCMHEAKCH